MKKKVIATTLVTVVLVAGVLFTVNGCADKNTDSSQTAKTETSATITDADTTEKESVDVADADKDTDDSETVKADAAKTGKTKDDSDKEPATQAPATTEAPTTQAPAPSTQAPTTQEPRTEEPRAEEPTTAHQHTWTTIIDKDEWDEPIYEEQDVYEWHSMWPDGSYADELLQPSAKQRWCMLHCTHCNPECSDPDPAGRCAFSITDGEVWVGTKKVQVGTRHHDAVTHQECSVCGARK